MSAGLIGRCALARTLALARAVLLWLRCPDPMPIVRLFLHLGMP